MVNTREFKQGPWRGLIQVLATNMEAGITVSDGGTDCHKAAVRMSRDVLFTLLFLPSSTND